MDSNGSSRNGSPENELPQDSSTGSTRDGLSGSSSSRYSTSRRYRRRANAERNWQVVLRAAIIGAYCLVLLIAGLYLGHKGRERPEPDRATLIDAPQVQDPATYANAEEPLDGLPDPTAHPVTATAATEPSGSEETQPQPAGQSGQNDSATHESSMTGEEEGHDDTDNTGGLYADDTSMPAAAGPRETPSWPVQGEVVGEPGWVFSEYLNEWRYLPGVEIAVDPGTLVVASMSGTVKSVTNDPDLGTVVTLEHPDGTTTEYGRLSGCILGVGDTVKQGEEIARTDGTTFYFAAKVNDEAVMVTKYLTP